MPRRIVTQRAASKPRPRHVPSLAFGLRGDANIVDHPPAGIVEVAVNGVETPTDQNDASHVWAQTHTFGPPSNLRGRVNAHSPQGVVPHLRRVVASQLRPAFAEVPAQRKGLQVPFVETFVFEKMPVALKKRIRCDMRTLDARSTVLPVRYPRCSRTDDKNLEARTTVASKPIPRAGTAGASNGELLVEDTGGAVAEIDVQPMLH